MPTRLQLLIVMVTTVIGLLAVEGRAGDFVLVRDGVAQAKIVIAPETLPREADMDKAAKNFFRNFRTTEQAARDLQLYVYKATGALLPIMRDIEDVRGPMVLIGESQHTRRLNLMNNQFKEQEYLIKADENRLILMGYDETYQDWVTSRINPTYPWSTGLVGPASSFQPTGSHYAVAEFLERVCGVRWYFPGEIGEVVPKRKDIVVPEMQLRRRPSVRMRYINRDHMPDKFYFEPHILKEGTWKNCAPLRPTFDWGTRLKMGGEVFACNHFFYDYFDRFAQTHPQWWRDRKPGKWLMPCLTEPGVVEQVAQDARDHFDGKRRSWHAGGKYFSVVPLDNESWCECDRCSAEYVELDGPVDEGEPKRITRSNYVWGFIAKVAGQLKKTHPDKFISCVAYRAYFFPPDPKKVQLPDNVVVQICPGFDALSSPRIYPPYATTAEAHEVWFADWAKIVKPDHVYMWWYWLWPTNPSYQSFPNVSPYVVGDFVRAMKRHGFTGGAMCQNDEAHGIWWSYPVLDHLRVYVMAKMMDDWDLDERDIVNEYYRLFYGPAEAPMKRFWEYLHRTPYNEQRMAPVWSRKQSQTPKFDWTVLCPPEELKQLGEWLDEARELTPEDSIYRRRVDLIDSAVYQAYLVRASKEVLGDR